MNVPKCVSWNLWCTSGGLQLKYGNLCSLGPSVRKTAMEYELFWVRICKGCAIRAMLSTAKGFQKVLNQFPFLLPQSCRIFTIVLRCIEKFTVWIYELPAVLGQTRFSFGGVCLLLIGCFPSPSFIRFGQSLCCRWQGAHIHMWCSHTPRLNKWFPCPINPIILCREPAEFRKSTPSRAGCHGELRKYESLIGKSSTAMVIFPGELLTYQTGYFLGLPEALASSFSVVAWSQTHIWTQISSPI